MYLLHESILDCPYIRSESWWHIWMQPRAMGLKAKEMWKSRTRGPTDQQGLHAVTRPSALATSAFSPSRGAGGSGGGDGGDGEIVPGPAAPGHSHAD